MAKFHLLTVKDIRRETDDCVSVAFEVPETLAAEFSFLPGQHLTIKKMLGGEEIRRNYSICTSPLDKDLRIAIKRIEEGKFSNFSNEVLQVGDQLEVMSPLGSFTAHLDDDNEKFYVAFAAGSGITPVISIMKTVLQEEPKSFFTLFYGNRSKKSIIFHEEIEALKNQYMGRLSVHYILSREYPGSDLFYGRIDDEKSNEFFKKLIPVPEVDEFFLCGPEEMIHSVRRALEEKGVEKKKIHFELFTTSGQVMGKTSKKKKDAPKVMSHLSVTLDGNTFSFDLLSTGETILDAASRHGAELPFACKGGVCATCKARLTEGEVEMDLNYALEPEEVEAGYILTCQSHPRSEKVAVNFDI